MGNCLRRPESEVEWGGENWSHVLTTEADDEKLAMKMEAKLGKKKKKKNEDDYHNNYSSNGNKKKKMKSTQVKIKISKKELEKMMVMKEDDEVSVHQLLVQLMEAGAHFQTHHTVGWRPRLQSIPELN